MPGMQTVTAYNGREYTHTAPYTQHGSRNVLLLPFVEFQGA